CGRAARPDAAARPGHLRRSGADPRRSVGDPGRHDQVQGDHRPRRPGQIPRRSLRAGRALDARGQGEMNAPNSAIASAARLAVAESPAPPSRLLAWMRAALRRLLPVAGISVIGLGWHLVAVSGAYTEEQLPGPLAVWRAAGEIWANGALLGHVGASLARFGTSYLAAVTVAVPRQAGSHVPEQGAVGPDLARGPPD